MEQSTENIPVPRRVKTFPRIMKPACSSMCSQQPATCCYPELDASSSRLPTIFLKAPFQYYIPIYAYVFQAVFPSDFPTKTLYASLPFLLACYMPRPGHSSSFGQPNNVWPAVKTTSLCIMHVSPASCCFLPLGPNNFSSTTTPDIPSLCSSLK
jgi:hypothetical protein